jgi:hypothetical protein
MITTIFDLREVRRAFTVDEELNERVSALLQATLDEWQVLDMLLPMDFALGELVRWINGHGTSDRVYCSITWDQTLLFIELRDRGGLIPEPHVSRVDAELATRLLAPPAVEWGAELDTRGRHLWVSFAVPSALHTLTTPDDRGRLR